MKEILDPLPYLKNLLSTNHLTTSDKKQQYYFIIDGMRVYVYIMDELNNMNFTMPCVILSLMSNTEDISDVTGNSRKVETYIDIHIYVSETDKIDYANIQKIKNYIYDKIRTNQNNIKSYYYMTVQNAGILIIEGKNPVLHYVMTVYCMSYKLNE